MIKEPPLEEILRVNQRAFGYINPEVNKLYLEAIGLTLSIGVYVRDDNKQLQALAYIHKSRLEYRDKITQFLAYLKNEQLTDGNFDEVLILRSKQADKIGVAEIYSALRIRGYKPKIIDGDWVIGVIFDKDGNMYWVDPKTIQAEEKSDLNFILTCLEMRLRKGLKCENTERIITNQVDFLYPGLGRTFHVVNQQYGAYGVRVPIKGKFNEGVLNELKPQGLKLSLKECKYGKYIEIAKYGYPLFLDEEVIVKVNNLAARLMEKI